MNEALARQDYAKVRHMLDSTYKSDNKKYYRRINSMFYLPENVNYRYSSSLYYLALHYDEIGDWTRAGQLILEREEIAKKNKGTQNEVIPIPISGSAILLRAGMKEEARNMLKSANREMKSYYSGKFDRSIFNFPPHDLDKIVLLNLRAEGSLEALEILGKAEKFYDLNYGILTDAKTVAGVKFDLLTKMGKTVGFNEMLTVLSLKSKVYHYTGKVAQYEQSRLFQYQYTAKHFTHPQEKAWLQMRYLSDVCNLSKNTFAYSQFHRHKTKLDSAATYSKELLPLWDDLEAALLMQSSWKGQRTKFEIVDSLIRNVLYYSKSEQKYKASYIGALEKKLQWSLINGRIDIADSAAEELEQAYSIQLEKMNFSNWFYSNVHEQIANQSIYHRIKGNHTKADSLLRFYNKMPITNSGEQYAFNSTMLQHAILKESYPEAMKFGKESSRYIITNLPLKVEPFSMSNTLDIHINEEYNLNLYLTALLKSKSPAPEIDTLIRAKDNFFNEVTQKYFENLRSKSSSNNSLKSAFSDYYYHYNYFLSIKDYDNRIQQDSIVDLFEERLYQQSLNMKISLEEELNSKFDSTYLEQKLTADQLLKPTNPIKNLNSSGVSKAGEQNNKTISEGRIAFFKSSIGSYFYRLKPVYVAVIYDGSTPVNHKYWENVEEIDSLIHDMNFLLSKRKDATELRKKLSDILLKPILPDIEKFTTLRIKNDGQLNFLNWSVLVNPSKPSQNVIDRWEIVINNTMDFKNHDFSGNQVKNCLVIGDIDFHQSIENQEASRKELLDSLVAGNRSALGELGVNALPYTKKEIEDITESLGNKRKINLLTGVDATESKIGELSKDADVIHFATHGVFATTDEELSALYGWKNINSYLYTDPMLSSALLLSNSGDAIYTDEKKNFGADGILSAFEIMNLQLSQSKLVVLSACESGNAVDLQGIGLSGLQRAFFVAGTENLIVSYWEVNDEFASLFMAEFYENWIQKGSSLINAFKETQRSFMKKGGKWNSPYYWGSFVLIQR